MVGGNNSQYGDDEYVAYVVTDVLNFGGFFGGETVTLDATPRAQPEKWASFIIPEHVFTNLTQRHLIAPGMALGLVVDNGEIRSARVLGAPTREQLKDIVRVSTPESGGPGPRALSYKCAACNLWVTGTPEQREATYFCTICGTKLG